MSGRNEWGDYQTPFDFAMKICNFLKMRRNVKPTMVFEPTCGIGNFLKAALIFDASSYMGIEINPTYCKICTENIPDDRVKILNADFFRCDSSMLPKINNLLIIGNPPWINNSTLSKINSANLPARSNFDNLRGIDALTGASDFDICEYMIRRLIEEYRDTETTIAVLCKMSVARKIFQSIHKNHIACSSFEIFEFDANKIFSISASACLACIRLGTDRNFPAVCNVYNLDAPDVPAKNFGYRDGKFYSDVSAGTYDLEGKCCFEWRQGIKHDCSRIMELTLDNDTFKNGNGDTVDIESAMIFPLIKSSSIKFPILDAFEKYVIVTQRFLGEDTAHLKLDAPKTWHYLNEHVAAFRNRKSRIYANAPEFAMFGVGEYAYSPYKVCVSGFNKTPLFAVTSSQKPVMADDTCYFISFKNYDAAYLAMLYLNSDKVQRFLLSLAFEDAKRPFTKRNLQRIDFSKVCSAISIEELTITESKFGIKGYLRKSMLDSFLEFINPDNLRLFD